MAIQKTGILVDTDPAFPSQTAFEQSGQQSMITAIGLEPDTTYHVKGYVVVDGERVYSSNTKQFTTRRVEYLTIKNTANTDNTITLANGTRVTTPVTLEYSIDGGAWTSWTSGSSNLSAVVPAGKSVRFRGDNATFSTDTTSSIYYFTFYSTQSCEISGDVTTLLNRDGNANSVPDCAFYSLFKNLTNANINSLILPSATVGDKSYSNMFSGCTGITQAPTISAATIGVQSCEAMFSGCTSLTTAPNLPATTLAQSCYFGMFSGCISLTTAPNLPATDLTGASSCYRQMFQGCTSLTTAPNLPATTLDASCYYSMFYGCTGLTSAPSLPATDLTGASSCYQQMFYNCTSLTTAPNLPATTLASSCYYSMFYGCIALAQAPTTLPATDLTGASSCYRQMFYGCSVLTQGPTLPATTLDANCYQQMFYNCTSLTTSPTLSATTLASSCYLSMFQGCSALTQVPTLPATTLASSCYYSMFQGCTSITTAHNLPATTLASSCYYSMFYGCTSLSSVPSNMLPATTLTTGCYRQMFRNCTSLTTAPTLPATTPTASQCYYYMFAGCTSLNKIITYATTWSTSSANNWVNSVASTGDFYNLGQANIPIDNVSGVPIGWTLHTSLADYLTLTNTANGQNTIRITRTGNPNITLDYTTDNGSTWTTWTSSTDLSITLNANGAVKFKGTNATFNGSSNYIKFNSSDTCSVSGDINTLLNEVGGDIALPVHAFSYLFDGMTNLTNGGIILPSTTLSNYCYTEMFRNTAITTAPSLSATTIAIQSYQEMFYGCTSLVNAPSLPATTLAEHCYDSMFSGCTGLLTAPATLSATTLTEYCYARMFKGCTSLTIAPSLNATTLADHCCSEMFNGCTALTTAPTTLPATTLAEYCYTMMFYHCTSLTTAPELRATTLADYCYWEMFNGCTSLNKVITYASDISATDCILYWLSSVAASGDFYNIGGATYQSGASGIPSGWTVHTSL